MFKKVFKNISIFLVCFPVFSLAHRIPCSPSSDSCASLGAHFLSQCPPRILQPPPPPPFSPLSASPPARFIPCFYFTPIYSHRTHAHIHSLRCLSPSPILHHPFIHSSSLTSLLRKIILFSSVPRSPVPQPSLFRTTHSPLPFFLLSFSSFPSTSTPVPLFPSFNPILPLLSPNTFTTINPPVHL